MKLCKHDWVGDDHCVYCENERLVDKNLGWLAGWNKQEEIIDQLKTELEEARNSVEKLQFERQDLRHEIDSLRDTISMYKSWMKRHSAANISSTAWNAICEDYPYLKKGKD